MLRWVSAAAVTCALAACGGGGGSAGTPAFGGDNPSAEVSDLLVSVPAQLSNTLSSTATVTVTALDASRNAMKQVPVTITADNGAVLVTSDTQTDDNGKLTAVLTAGTDRSNRVITVTATAGSISRTAQIQVTGTTITSTLVPAVLAPGADGQIRYLVLDQAGDKMANQAVEISAPGMDPSSVTGQTGLDGEFVFDYKAPASAGSYQVSATIAGVSDVQTVQVQTVSTVPAVTTAITSASVSASPSVVGINSADNPTLNRTEIRALFLGNDNKPIPNVRVRFDLAGDANSIGGSFTTGTQTLYSDANGVATTAYVPGERDSPTNGVTVRACYGRSDSDPNLLNCSTFATVSLTVTNSPLAVSIGTNENIIDNDLSYIKQFLVSVVDSSGAAKADVNLTVSIDLPQYRKGHYIVNVDSWAQVLEATCVNEDANRNGVLETGEDIDGDSRLDPGKSDVSVRLLQSKTRADGTAIVEIQYAKSFASWVDAWITVAASGVSGTEGRATFVVAPVPVPAEPIQDTDHTPAFVTSPYGTSASCSNPQ